MKIKLYFCFLIMLGQSYSEISVSWNSHKDTEYLDNLEQPVDQEDLVKPVYHEDLNQAVYHQDQLELNDHEDLDKSAYKPDFVHPEYHEDMVKPVYHQDLIKPFYHHDLDEPDDHDNGSRVCSPQSPCPLRAGDCNSDADCAGSLKCGTNNCKLEFGLFSQQHKRWDLHDDCCSYHDTFCNQELLYPKYRRTCCTPSNPCPYSHGVCTKDDDCQGFLVCGDKNCGQIYNDAGPLDSCCVYPSNITIQPQPVLSGHIYIPHQHPKQPMPVYHEDGSRKCSPSSPCPYKAGDCEDDSDCLGDLKCGINNCKLEFGLFSQEHKRWDQHSDCCTYNPHFCNLELLYPKCRRSCCTPSTPCPHSHGVCQTDQDCEGMLVCGKQNCAHFHDDAGPKDNCCVHPKLEYVGFFYRGANRGCY